MEQKLSQQVKPHDLKRGEWVILVDNRFYFHYVYIFSVLIKLFQLFYHPWSRARKQHAARIKDGHVIEMLGSGKTITPLEVWFGKQNRTVAVFRPLVPFVETPNLPYGYYDLPVLVWNRIRKSLKLKIGGTWNGVDHVPVAGFFCNEEVLKSLGEEKGFLYLPADLYFYHKLQFVGEFRTTKK